MTQSSSASAAHDAAASIPTVFQVEIYLITVPQNTFSNNEAFWKRMNEQCLDPGTSDLLQKNGIRVGVASADEAENLDKYLDGVLPVRKFSMTAAEIKDMPITMHDPVQVQDIFHFDRQNELVGRTFPESVNIMNVSFAPAPRKPGQLRLTLCPMVRATREKLQLVGDDQQVGLKFVTPETLYDLNFSVDIPVDSFLIVTPSPDAQRLTSMGNAFFIKETPSERQEQIMLVMPWPHEVQKRVASAKK